LTFYLRSYLRSYLHREDFELKKDSCILEKERKEKENLNRARKRIKY